MMNSAIASLALFGASALAGTWGYDATEVGEAIVVNQCKYPVKLCNVPASGGGYEQEDTTLAPGATWSQPWTELSNGNGWSIKLSKTDSLDHILQYEYTFHNNGIIWYDLSCVDGNPWDKDWQLTANGSDCSPKQQAYRYSTDDAYGMQSCSQDTLITVTLCTGTSVDDGETVDVSSAAPSYSTATAASAPSYQTSTAVSAPSYETSTTEAPQYTPTTLSTSVTVVSSADDGDDDGALTITEVVTAYATAEVTAYANRFRRHDHEHVHGHQHHA